ncbi:hypothetical protein TNCV_951371 [Trichonephila clavipes]|nr:hypothetical protein TNCV_951371 [Trichonephila clavipes]
MEAVGATRIFQRFIVKRGLKYAHYYGDGDSKGFIGVKDTYGKDSVPKYKCIGLVQKRVGSSITAYTTHENKLMAVISEVSELSMQYAASELLVLHPPKYKIFKCGVSVDGTRQLRAPVLNRIAAERKLLESEATTGFFELLGERQKKATLEWNEKERLTARNGVSISRCRSQSKENPHDVDHLRVNHSLTFVDPETGTSTNKSKRPVWQRDLETAALKNLIHPFMNSLSLVLIAIDLGAYEATPDLLTPSRSQLSRMTTELLLFKLPHYANGIEVEVGITFQDGDRFNSCQVIYSQFGLAIHQNDHQARRRFIEWAQNEIAVVPDFHKRILFSDEVHFGLNGYVNNQNCRIWSEANPQVYVETPLHPEKLTVWCALWAGGILLQKR